eukprot:COSAG06_NODE_16388_length_1004_cov_0.861878_2_plen_71_part_01
MVRIAPMTERRPTHREEARAPGPRPPSRARPASELPKFGLLRLTARISGRNFWRNSAVRVSARAEYDQTRD